MNIIVEEFVARKSSERSRQGSSRKGMRPLSNIVETRELTPGKASRPPTKAIPKKQVVTVLLCYYV